MKTWSLCFLSAITLLAAIAMLFPETGAAQAAPPLAHSFELIYCTKDARFRGRTGFREEDSRPELTTAQRIDYLRLFAARLTREGGSQVGAPVVTSVMLRRNQAILRPLPLPNIRKVQPLVWWKWQLDSEGKGQGSWHKVDLDDKYWNETHLPFIRQTSYDLWLRAQLVPAGQGRAFLEVEAAIDGCWIWVNGEEVKHQLGYAPFRVEITPVLRPGQANTVALRIPAKRGDQIGLAGSVRLVFTGDQRIEDPFVFTRTLDTSRKGNASAVEAIYVNVANLASAPFQGTVRVVLTRWGEKPGNQNSAQGSAAVHVGAGQQQRVEIEVRVPHPALWSPAAPNLYEAHLYLDARTHLVDDVVVITGIRKIEERGARLFLNNTPLFLAGFLDMLSHAPQSLFTPHSYIAEPDQMVLTSILTAKLAGANVIRIHPVGMRQLDQVMPNGWPPMTVMTDGTNYSRYAEVADQLGIMLIWPTRFWGWQESFFDGDKEQQLKNDVPPSIREVWNHPSIIAYEGMNEVGMSVQDRVSTHASDPAAIAQVARYKNLTADFARTVHDVDPTRLITPDSGWCDVLHGKLEPYFADGSTIDAPNIYWDLHRYDGWYSPINQLWDALSGPFDPGSRQKPLLLTEFGSEAMPDWSLYTDQPWYGVWINNASIPDGEIETRAIGRPFRVLRDSEYKLSQAYQALIYQLVASAVRDHGGDGLLACTLADGFAEGFYHKGAVDLYNRAKLGFVMARTLMQKLYPNGADGDMVFAPSDALHIRVSSISESTVKGPVTLVATVLDAQGKPVGRRELSYSELRFGATAPVEWRPEFPHEGFYFIDYVLRSRER